MVTKLNKKAVIDIKSIGQELKDIIGAEKVKDDDIVLVTHGVLCHGFDTMVTPFRNPSFVVLPETTEDVVETLKLANKYKIPVTPLATGTFISLAQTSEGGIILDQRRRDKIIEINTDSGYVVTEPGVTFDKLTSALRGTGFKCQVATAPGSATPLGQHLGRGTNSFSNRYHTPIIDLEVALPDGTLFSTGSSHFGTAGSHLQYGPFPDLLGLYTCGCGTMGVVTKAAIRIHPVNEAHRIHMAAFDNYPDAIDYVKDLINNNIPEHCIIWNWHLYEIFALDPSSIETVMPQILKSDPRKPPEGTPYNIVTSFLSGYEEIVAAYEKVCAKIAQKYHGRIISEEEVEKRFPVTMAGFRQLYGDYHAVEATIMSLGRLSCWIVFAEPKDMKEIEKWAVKEFADMGLTPAPYYSHPFDFGRSIFFRIFTMPDTGDNELRGKIHTKYVEMFDKAMRRYGAIPISHTVWPDSVNQTGGYMDVLHRIKKALDPNNILNKDVGMFQEEKL